ncbi:hypothetical protein RQ528_27280 [Pseudomonas aeruginosa]|uniref:hypothetical protein n=1 Tax=Pseudomonas aeruginosa TaxID=287 RepID=UPI00093735CD|nr:hypothetical protein [Pseudomonas aeruginosa]MDT8141452.1 hypothetical protein [Pseudomonas aeruginosa]
MAIHLTDKLSRLFNETKYNRRYDTWLWYSLIWSHPEFHPYSSQNTGMREAMANFLAERSWLINWMKEKRSQQLLPDNSFDWIGEELRQTEWITARALQITGHNLSARPIDLTGKDLIVTLIDLWQTDITEKYHKLQYLAQSWRNQKARDKEYEWFKDDDQKSVLAWEWLNKNAYLSVLAKRPFERYVDTLTFFDSANLTPDQKSLYLDKIKKRWSQKKYRENLKGKAQYNFILSDKAIANLDKLANLHEISRAKVLEILLEMEAEKNDHIPERIRVLKLLNK